MPLSLALLLGPGRPGTAEEGEGTGGCSWSLGCQEIGAEELERWWSHMEKLESVLGCEACEQLKQKNWRDREKGG